MEARIIIQHTLDRSSAANLAQELAFKLGYIVEFGAYKMQEGQHHFIQKGTKSIASAKHIITLYDTSNTINSLH
ncbi:hypothetical protein ACRASX_15300 [Flavobacterium sp. TMP13]|uniref:hypothetical protein n=1 Tax=unclassified Flavobacterium TaxID=196869 RepID=UPI00076D8E7E|nr:hypothetical protein [Flavobacterium sp. TAB 87]KVV16273.1 hypothetical protein AP058_00208 [Flavobacterium sp. TAB 87]